MNSKKSNSSSLIFHWKRCASYVQLPLLSLVIYMALPSTQLFAAEDIASNYPWHAAYAGWYDLFLAYSILLCFASGVIEFGKDTFIFVLVLSIIVVLSLLNNFALGSQYILDALVFLSRFVLTFSLAKELVRSLGTQTTESFLIILFIILSITALFAYNLQFGINNRIYAATMTSPSFGQVAAVVCLIAVLRNYKIILLISALFLFFTFSRTSIIVMLLLLLVHSWDMPIQVKLKYYIITATLMFIIVFLFLQFGGEAFEDVISSRTDIDEISTLNSRDLIWNKAFELFKRSDIPLFGAGFASTPSLIAKINLKMLTTEGWYIPPHFHSIILEYSLSFGISSLFIFYYLFIRVWQTFTMKSSTAFFIFAYFLVSQTFDFTLFRPKEIIIWAFLLGIAEGNWKKVECEHNSQARISH